MTRAFEREGVRGWVRTALLVAGALGFCGCAVIGPRSIKAGRGPYAEVINQTADQQILNAIVRIRYDQTFGMISVASVTAGLRFRAEAGINAGFGDASDYAGNLTPFAAGVAYEENPTISYVPLSGEDFMRRMLSPVATDQWLLLDNASKHPGHLFDLAIARLNELRNPLGGDAPPSADFGRFVELYDRLRRAGVLDVVLGAEAGTEYFLDFHDYEDQRESVREMLDLAGVDVELSGAPLLVPVRPNVGSSTSAVHVKHRSAHEVLQIFGAGAEIPPPHLEAGIVEPLRWPLPARRRFITIRSSEKRPHDATVRIRFRDWWFYVDATDTASKRAFVFIRTFIGMRLQDPGAETRAPVITIPVN